MGRLPPACADGCLLKFAQKRLACLHLACDEAEDGLGAKGASEIELEEEEQSYLAWPRRRGFYPLSEDMPARFCQDEHAPGRAPLLGFESAFEVAKLLQFLEKSVELALLQATDCP